MSSSLKYVFDLKERNDRIYQLVNGINKFNRNKHHLDLLMKEYIEVSSELERLNEKWQKEYVPAVEKRQALSRKLYLARNQPFDFKSEVFREIQNLSQDSLLGLIKQLQDSFAENKLYQMQLRDAQGPMTAEPQVSHSPSELQPSKSYLCEVQSRSLHESLPERSKSEKNGLPVPEMATKMKRRAHMSWSVKSAQRQLDELEAKYTELAKSMRSIGTQSCELTARINKMQNKISVLEDAMRLPTRHIYYEVELEYLPLQLEVCEAHFKTTKLYCMSTHTATSPHRECQFLGQDDQPYGSFNFCTESSGTDLVSPLWTNSASTSIMDGGSVAADFLKSTELSFSEIASNWAVSSS